MEKSKRMRAEGRARGRTLDFVIKKSLVNLGRTV